MNELLKFFYEFRDAGIFDEFNENHILNQALNNNDKAIATFCSKRGLGQYTPNAISFLINFSNRLHDLYEFFGKKAIETFILDQLSSGKENYSEEQFARAYAEIEILSYMIRFEKTIEHKYEPTTNGKKNPEASITYEDNTRVTIEVKAPGFSPIFWDENEIGIIQPNLLFDLSQKDEFVAMLKSHSLGLRNNSAAKLRSYIKSATEKFTAPEWESDFNVLCINYILSPWGNYSLEEVETLLLNPATGLLTSKIGNNYLLEKNGNIDANRLKNISAFLIYCSDSQSILFTDFRLCLPRVQIFPNPYAINQDITSLCKHFYRQPRDLNCMINGFSLFFHAMKEKKQLPPDIGHKIHQELSKISGLDKYIISYELS